MDRRRLGDTGIGISPLGLGTVKFGRNTGVKYPQGFEIPDEAALADLLTLAKDLGINMLDTAPAYGTSEERLGHLLKGRREDWVIVGKAGEEFEDGKSVYNFNPEYFEMSLERSLKRLNTDYIDVLMVHSDGNDVENLSDDLIAKMQDFKARGLVRAIGASTKTVVGGLRALETMDVVMACYNADYTDEKPVLDYAAEHNKGVLLKKVLGSGHNTDVEAAFRFAFVHPGTSGIIVGTINPVHLRTNIEAINRVLAA
ncbi:MAG TPA: aldo/keto reductase [Alphaproteobacteria bacterium]|nr:aldo/keto reductase [Alphaproteobacteria bacterium]USO06381.1 MAG: aldo/keto reductase [Rhodospirillales bacterium]HOO82400.1 aldo/keto reductase [Alphaproteobacteria bacterium]